MIRSRFIEPFMEYFEKVVDSPYAFGTASALMTLSGIALGRRWIDRGVGGIKPNLYFMIVGPPGVAHKSTCVTISKNLLKEVDEHRVGPTDYTMEGLVRWMGQKNPVTNKSRTKVVLHAEEFGSDLDRMSAYAKTVMGDLCRLYDGETFTKVRAVGPEVTIDKPRVAMFAAGAYDMLTKHLSYGDWSNGFLMRYLYVAPHQMRPEYTTPPPKPVVEWDRALRALSVLQDDLARHTSSMGISTEAESTFAQFTTFLKQVVAPLSDLHRIYAQRFLVSVLKLSMLYQIDVDPFSSISADAMNNACQYANTYLWPSFSTTIEMTTSRDFQSLFDQVTRLLKAQPAPKRILAGKYAGNRTLDDVIQHMQRMNLVATKKHMNGSGNVEEVLFWQH